MPSKCWYCELVRNCQDLKPCNKFVKWRKGHYRNKTLAEMMKISERSFYRLKKLYGAEKLATIISERTGKRFEYDQNKRNYKEVINEVEQGI